LKKTRYPSTGIYLRTVTAYGSRPEGMERGFKRLAEESDLDAMLDQCERYARGALEWAWDRLGDLAKRDPWLSTRLAAWRRRQITADQLRAIVDGRRKLKAGEQVEPVSELAAPTIVAEIREHNMEPGKSRSRPDLDELRAAETLEDAHLVLLQTHSVRQWRVKGNLDNAIMEAIRLGFTAERLRVRPVEPLAAIGRVQRVTIARAGQAKAETQRAIWPKLRTSFVESREHFGRPYSTVVAELARRFSISEKTVRRHTRDLR
jgi:hypothetical protein